MCAATLAVFGCQSGATGATTGAAVPVSADLHAAGPYLLVAGEAGLRVTDAKGASLKHVTSEPTTGMTACGPDFAGAAAANQQVTCLAKDGKVTTGDLGSVPAVCGETEDETCIVREATNRGDRLCFYLTDGPLATEAGGPAGCVEGPGQDETTRE